MKTIYKALLLIAVIVFLASLNPWSIKQYVTEHFLQNTAVSKQTTIEGINLEDTGEQVQGKLGKPGKTYTGIQQTTWWIYNTVWVGLRNNKVIEIFSNQEKVSYGTIKPGMTRPEVEKVLAYNTSPSWIMFNSSIAFTNELDKKVLYKQGNRAFIAYYDTLDNNRLLGFRVVLPEELVIKGFFGYNYRSFIPPSFPDYKTNMDQVNKDEAEEILLLSNQEREKKGVPDLNWSDSAAKSAFIHSKDMSDHNYFSHTFSDGRTPFDLMKEQGIVFRLASENIAMGYRDGIEAVYGWMNSSGHRHSLLNADLKRMGVGVYNYYYTQHFYTPG